VWRTGSPRWAPISAVVPMPAYLPPQPVGHQSPPDPLQYTQAGSTNRVLIGIMGIVFGWAGVHKFMLGYTQAGVIMAVIGVVGFFCYGIGWLVMGVIGAIEGIIYLTKGDQQFYNEYVLRKKEWF
ncbi:MAG: hypothetical protein JWO57_655, partial [Pseudonocardiales bacterium]|nr:hypothetical protein [Pseudonocardiales bacterium]